MSLPFTDSLEIVATHPVAPHNSRNGAAFVIASDGLDYVAKPPTAAAPQAPLAEFVSHWIAQRCAIPTPLAAWLRPKGGGPALFGSRFEVGVEQYTTLNANERVEAALSCLPTVWRVCVLDVFLGNPDRHWDNLLLRRSVLDQRWTVLAMDWGNGLWSNGFPQAPVELTARAGNTAATISLLRTLGVADRTIAASVAASLAAIRAEHLASQLQQIPASARCVQADELPEWWASQARLDRVQRTLEVLCP